MLRMMVSVSRLRWLPGSSVWASWLKPTRISAAAAPDSARAIRPADASTVVSSFRIDFRIVTLPLDDRRALPAAGATLRPVPQAPCQPPGGAGPCRKGGIPSMRPALS